MQESQKDVSQDKRIAENAERIKRNEEAIKRQTSALEQIRDHYYPPPAGMTRRVIEFFLKALCVVLAYAGGVQAVDWYVDTRQAKHLAACYAGVAQRLFFRESNAAGAARFYEKAIELDDDVSYRTALTFMNGMSLGADLFLAGRPLTADEQTRVDAALAEAFFLQEAEPDDPMPNVLMAQAFMLRGEKAESVAAIDRAVQCDPERAAVRVSSCTMHFFAGQVAEARKQLAEAERLDATLPLVSCWKGFFALMVDHDAEAARAHFEALTRTLPRQALGHALLGRALLAGKTPDVKGARAAFNRAVELDTQQKMALQGMAETYERENNLILARLWLDKALETDANSMAARIARARIRSKSGDFAAAIDDLTFAIQLAPFRADLYKLRAAAYEKTGDASHAQSDTATAHALTH